MPRSPSEFWVGAQAVRISSVLSYFSTPRNVSRSRKVRKLLALIHLCGRLMVNHPFVIYSRCLETLLVGVGPGVASDYLIFHLFLF